MPPEEFGWDVVDGLYMPRQGHQEVCPAAIKKMLACGCKKGKCLTDACSCRKSKVTCSDQCKCQDELCENIDTDDRAELSSDEDSDANDV